MALVVLLRGINVGGHRRFRPAALARELKHLDVVNIGAAGTFVIRRPIAQAQLRAQVARRLPFEAEIVIVRAAEIARAIAHEAFRQHPVRSDTVRFISVMSRRPVSQPSVPMTLPGTGEWLVKLVAVDNRFVYGVYRRHMKVIACLGALDRLFGVPLTTRNWNTLTAVANVLGAGAQR